MTCNEVNKMLSEYIDDALGTQERLAVEKHIATCHECRSELTSMSRLVSAAHGTSEENAPIYLRQRILMACEAERQHAEDLASAFIDNELTGEDLASAHARLESDTFFADICNSTKQLSVAASRLSLIESPSRVREAVYEEVSGERDAGARSILATIGSFFDKRIPRFAASATAAAVAATILIVFFASPSARGPVTSSPAPESGHSAELATSVELPKDTKTVSEEIAELPAAGQQAPTNVVRGYVDAPSVVKAEKKVEVSSARVSVSPSIPDSDFENLVSELEKNKKSVETAQASENTVADEGINTIEASDQPAKKKTYKIKVGKKDTEQLLAAVSNRYNKESDIDKKLESIAEQSAIRSDSRRAEYNFVETSF